jgi:hypothetical protein
VKNRGTVGKTRVVGKRRKLWETNALCGKNLETVGKKDGCNNLIMSTFIKIKGSIQLGE